MNEPLVSVIITTYNRFDFLCRAIDSVLAQTYSNIEIIVVDDCSTDATESKIKKKLGKIEYIRNSRNLGRSASRNIGIKLSTGDYISFLDDDDELMPDKIEKQVYIFLSKNIIDVVYCGSIRKNNNYILEKAPKLKGNIYPQVLDSCPNAIHTLLIKKECFGSIGVFDESFDVYEDLDLWIRLSKKYRFDYVEENLVIYHIHGSQTSSQLLLMISGKEMLLEKYKDDYEQNRKYLNRHLKRLASRYVLLGDYSMFRKYINRALVLNPFSPSLYIHIFLSIYLKKLHKKLILQYGVTKIGDILLG